MVEKLIVKLRDQGLSHSNAIQYSQVIVNVLKWQEYPVLHRFWRLVWAMAHDDLSVTHGTIAWWELMSDEK